MSMFIRHTLMMLEDAGMRIKYPVIMHITLDEDGNENLSQYISAMRGRRVSIEQNQHMKFLILFTLLDFHVDAFYPDLEGESYRKKYKNLPAQCDYNLIFRQLFRVAKVIRNALVHNQSSSAISNGEVSIDYKRRETHFCLKMSSAGFDDLHTAIVMYVSGEMGEGHYFLGIMRSIYARILASIRQFSDEFDCPLEVPTAGIKMKWNKRRIVQHPPYETRGDVLRFPIAARQIPEGDGDLDLYFVLNDEEILVPREALDEDLSITKQELITRWKREGRFPQIKAS